MELSIRDWMFVIGVLLLLAVALDGYRRARRERRNQVKLSRNAKRAARRRIVEEPEPEQERERYTSELPGGGARRVVRSNRTTADSDEPEAPVEKKALKEKKEPTISFDDDMVEGETESMEESPEKQSSPAVGRYDIDPLFTDPFKSDDRDELSFMTAEETNIQPSLFDCDDSSHASDPQDILVLHVMASSKEGFAGEDLLHILLACDCRFGEMNIFHRYESENARGKIQFSIVNVVEPGVFKLNDIKNFSTPGVSFFLRLPGPKDPMDAFNCMVETAQCLVRNLDGKLTDEGRSTVTEQTLEHYRQRIRDFLKNQLVSV